MRSLSFVANLHWVDLSDFHRKKELCDVRRWINTINSNDLFVKKRNANTKTSPSPCFLSGSFIKIISWREEIRLVFTQTCKRFLTMYDLSYKGSDAQSEEGLQGGVPLLPLHRGPGAGGPGDQ